MLTASLISAVIGTKLPGPGCIYMSQTLKFLAPVYIGETVYATVTVRELVAEKKHVILETHCTVKGKKVIEGEARIKVAAHKR
jgi:3-hydroxybutyryl-CoA dehydratase